MKTSFRKWLYTKFHPLLKYKWYELPKYGEFTLFGYVVAIHVAESAEHSIRPIFDWESLA